MLKKMIAALLLLTVMVFADKITIFAASDLKFALDKVRDSFLKAHPNDVLNMIYGSSGKGMLQVQNGAPYDIYFSANMDYVKRLHKDGSIISKPKLYAIGRIVLWSKNRHFDPAEGFDNLKENWVHKIAIANPSHAPYGQKAKQAMESLGLYKKLEDKIVFGENISATAGYISTQAVDIGIIALSLALAPNVANSAYSKYYLIDNTLHTPLDQGYGITKYGKNSKLAKMFYNYMQTKEVAKIMHLYGFVK